MMKIVRRDGRINGNGTNIEVKEAIEDSLHGHGRDGQLENIASLANSEAEMIATLIQLLVDNNVLTLEQVAVMFSYRYKLEEWS